MIADTYLTPLSDAVAATDITALIGVPGSQVIGPKPTPPPPANPQTDIYYNPQTGKYQSTPPGGGETLPAIFGTGTGCACANGDSVFYCGPLRFTICRIQATWIGVFAGGLLTLWLLFKVNERTRAVLLTAAALAALWFLVVYGGRIPQAGASGLGAGIK